MDQPLVSVFVATRNAAKFLPRAIDSVIRQSFTGWELFVCDFDSRDDTSRIAQSYCAADQRVTYMPSQSQPDTHSFRVGRGRYIKLLAADDCLLPNCLQTFVQVIEERPAVQLVSSARALIDDDDKRTEALSPPGRPLSRTGNEMIQLFLRDFANNIGCPSQIFFRRHNPDSAIRLDHNNLQALALQSFEQGDFFSISEPLVLCRLESETAATWALQNLAYLAEQVRLIDSFGHHAIANGATEKELWRAAIQALILEMENAVTVRGIAYEDFPPSPDWSGLKFPNDEPEKYRRLACQLLAYLTDKQIATNVLSDLRIDKLASKTENERLLERMHKLDEQIYARKQEIEKAKR